MTGRRARLAQEVGLAKPHAVLQRETARLLSEPSLELNRELVRRRT